MVRMRRKSSYYYSIKSSMLSIVRSASWCVPSTSIKRIQATAYSIAIEYPLRTQHCKLLVELVVELVVERVVLMILSENGMVVVPGCMAVGPGNIPGAKMDPGTLPGSNRLSGIQCLTVSAT